MTQKISMIFVLICMMVLTRGHLNCARDSKRSRRQSVCGCHCRSSLHCTCTRRGGGGILSVNVLSLNSPWKGMLKICFCFCLWNYVFKFSLLASAVQLWVHGSCLMHTVLKEAQGMDWGGHGDGGPSQVDTVMEAPVMWTCWWRPQSSGDVDTVMEAQSYSNVDMVTEAPVK